MPSAGVEPAIPAGGRLQPYALDRAAAGIGTVEVLGAVLLINRHVCLRWSCAM